jgi:predicted phosphoribosyltransferase
METRFRNRREAGRMLAGSLLDYADRPDVLVLGLPRGGVPVAAEVARRLRAPLDVFVVRKLGLPGQPELAMGAIAAGGNRVLNEDLIETLNIPRAVVEAVAAREQIELERREWTYRQGAPAPVVRGKTVILVDDGIATGATMMAAIAALRQSRPAEIVVAAPTMARETRDALRSHADSVVAGIAPERFRGVGEWYDDFSQTTDDEVRESLAEARSILARTP